MTEERVGVPVRFTVIPQDGEGGRGGDAGGEAFRGMTNDESMTKPE
jgi:hypothetical protein